MVKVSEGCSQSCKMSSVDFELRPESPLVSLVVPVFNEEDAIPLFISRVAEILTPVPINYEIIFVNDGSRDSTFDVVIGWTRREANIRLVNLSRNFGKESALTAGIQAATGDVVIPIDVDLQDPPELIPIFLDYWRKGYDVVYGIRTTRDSDSMTKRITAGWFYRIFNRFSKIKLPENAGDFRLLDRRVVDAINQLPERSRFMKGIFAWIGFKSVGVPYGRPARSAGITTWNYWKLWNFALDGLFAFSTMPLRVWTYVGTTIALISFLYAAIIVSKVLVVGRDVPGYASLMTVILFIGGIQLISIGIIGEYLGRLFEEVKSRPIFVIEGVYRQGGRTK